MRMLRDWLADRPWLVLGMLAAVVATVLVPGLLDPRLPERTLPAHVRDLSPTAARALPGSA